MKSKLIFWGNKNKEYQALQQVLLDNTDNFSLDLVSDLPSRSWATDEVLLLDCSSVAVLVRWHSISTEFTEIPCIGLFYQTQEPDALHLLEDGLISDYLVYEELSVFKLRKCLLQVEPRPEAGVFSGALSAKALSLGDINQKEYHHLQNLLNLFPQPVFIKNRQHQWVQFNRAFCAFMGQTETAIQGKTDKDFFPPEEADVFWAKDNQVFETGHEDVNEEFFTDAEGIQHRILTKKMRFIDQYNQPFLIGTITNIDQLKQKEDEIFRLKNNLELRVQERTEALLVSNQDLQREIDVRKQAEYQARQSQERLLAITQAMPDPSLVLDSRGKILAAYASDETLLYQSLDQIIQQNIFDILPEEFHCDIRKALEQTLETGIGCSYEYKMPVPAGLRWFEARTARVKSQEDKHVIFTIQDITSRKEYEHALYESEQKFKTIFNQTIQLMGVLDTQGRIIDINDTALNMVGVTLAQVKGKYFWESPWWHHSEELQEQVKETIQNAAMGSSFHFEATHKDLLGQTQFIDFAILPLKNQSGEIKYLIPTGHNITSLKQALDALANTEEQFSKAFEYAPIGEALISLQGRFFRVNKAFSDIFGYSPEELAGLKFKDLSHPDEVAEDICNLRKLMSRELDIYTREKRYFHKNGALIWGKLSLLFIRDAEGAPLFLIAQLENITRRKQALAELKQAEERFKHITNSIEDVIYTLDEELVCTSIYGAWNAAFNIDPEQLMGQRLKDMPFRTVHTHLSAHQEALKRPAFSYEWQIGQGERRLFFQTKLTPLKNGQGEIKGVVGAIHNITQLKQAEIQISASLQEKELLLREVYHRVKNNLQIISSMLNLQARQSQDEYTISLLNDIKNRVFSMAMVHEKLYESTGLSQLDFGQYLNELCSHLVNVYALRRSEIQLIFDCEKIYLDADIAIPCGLILNELVSNALKHAFSEQSLSPHEIKVSLLNTEPGFARLSVQDNGVGLPVSLDFETLESLGLRLVKRLSQQIDGKLTLQDGVGSKIEITFPI